MSGPRGVRTTEKPDDGLFDADDNRIGMGPRVGEFGTR